MIIVTGAAGLIGSNIIKELNRRGITKILAVDDVTDEKLINLVNTQVAIFLSTEEFYENFKDWQLIECIFHEGAISSTTERSTERIEKYNLDPSYWLIDRAIANNILISYASSASVYGDSKTFKEDQELDPKSLYAISKFSIDRYVTVLLKDNPTYKIQGWRYFNVYGTGESHKGDQASPVYKFSQQALEHSKIKIFKNSENYKRDFICVDDIVNIKLNYLEHNGITNLGTGTAVSFKSVAESVAQKYSSEIEEIDFPKELVGQYQAYTCADTTRLRSIIGDYKFKTIDDYLKSQ